MINSVIVADRDSNLDAGWTHDSIKSVLQKYITTEYSWEKLDKQSLGKLPKAAVLVPLFIDNGIVHVWLTKRSDKVGVDKGHVSFPGGMKEVSDKDEIATCLREAEEEIGLQANQVEVLGPIHIRLSRNGVLITPIVGIVDKDFRPVPNEEVATVFHLPLSRFLRQRGLVLKSVQFKKAPVRLLFFHDDINGETIVTWGITAVTCVEVAVAVLQTDTEYDFPFSGRLSPSDPFLPSKLYMQSLVNDLTMSKL